MGTSLMTVLPELLQNLEGGIVLFGMTLPPLYGLSQLILSGLLIVVIIFRPQGLLGCWEFSWSRLFGRQNAASGGGDGRAGAEAGDVGM